MSVKTMIDIHAVLMSDYCDEEQPNWQWCRSFATLRMTLPGAEIGNLFDPFTLSA
jgi:hypothetical protein